MPLFVAGTDDSVRALLALLQAVASLHDERGDVAVAD
jgi:hypothetical protein